jgi:hypothetical protein
MKTLENAVHERVNTAKEKKFYDKSKFLTEILCSSKGFKGIDERTGEYMETKVEQQYFRDCGESHHNGRTMTLKVRDLKIVDQYCEAFCPTYVEISTLNKEVFRGRSDDKVSVYVPGEWETSFEEFYQKVKRLEEEKERKKLEKEKAEKEADLRKRFGL